ncbi:MAG: PKD domain-containing protein, partial [Candidatus Hodarchaeota archaeon]
RWNDTIIIENSNKVDFKDITYKFNDTSLSSIAFTNSGQVTLINCTNSTISNTNISNIILVNSSRVDISNISFNHIRLLESSLNTIFDCNGNIGWHDAIFLNQSSCLNNITNNDLTNLKGYGISIYYYSNNNSIDNNTISGGFYSGIHISYSDYNAILNNCISSKERHCIFLGASCNNTIINNTMYNSSYGIYLSGNNFDNKIYFNAIYDNDISNSYLISGTGSDNIWDDGRSGNYWGDYEDIFTSATNDGVTWNQWYVMNGSRDRHPLVTPFVGDWLPASNFSVLNSSECLIAGSEIHFDFTGYGGNAPFTVAWDFGDGDNSTGTTTSHVYLTPGTHVVNCTVIDLNGDVNSTACNLTIIQEKTPSADFTASSTIILVGQEITFDFTGSTGNFPGTMTWDFGDGANSTDTNPSHVFNSIGTYMITLTIVDLDGDISIKNDVVIHVLDPAADDDGDGFSNEDELDFGTNPLDKFDTPLTLILIVVFSSVGVVCLVIFIYRRKRHP